MLIYLNIKKIQVVTSKEGKSSGMGLDIINLELVDPIAEEMFGETLPYNNACFTLKCSRGSYRKCLASLGLGVGVTSMPLEIIEIP
jgi:hypothetical protein